METFYSKTSKGALIETTVVGENPNKKGEFLYVRLKREVGGKFTAELHSSSNVNTDSPWIDNNPYSELQEIAIKLNGCGVTKYGVIRKKSGYPYSEPARIDYEKLIELGNKLKNIK